MCGICARACVLNARREHATPAALRLLPSFCSLPLPLVLSSGLGPAPTRRPPSRCLFKMSTTALPCLPARPGARVCWGGGRCFGSGHRTLQPAPCTLPAPACLHQGLSGQGQSSKAWLEWRREEAVQGASLVVCLPYPFPRSLPTSLPTILSVFRGWRDPVPRAGGDLGATAAMATRRSPFLRLHRWRCEGQSVREAQQPQGQVPRPGPGVGGAAPFCFLGAFGRGLQPPDAAYQPRVGGPAFVRRWAPASSVHAAWSCWRNPGWALPCSVHIRKLLEVLGWRAGFLGPDQRRQKGWTGR